MSAGLLAAAEKELRAFALGFPGAYEEFPWGESAFKVAKKMFAILRFDASARRLSLTLKLSHGHEPVLALPFVRPTGYNLGKSGWITSVFDDVTQVPTPVLRDWIAESYELVAPKRLLAELAV